MIKFVIMGVMVVGAGALGYFGERFMRPTAAPEHALADKKQELMFKLPLGNFTMQVIQTKRSLHLMFDIDVYVMGASAFQDINGAIGRARLRDATVTAIAELAETEFGFELPEADDATKTALAEKIVRKRYVDFPDIRTARVNTFAAVISDR
jgi:hypothetical protein